MTVTPGDDVGYDSGSVFRHVWLRIATNGMLQEPAVSARSGYGDGSNAESCWMSNDSVA